MRSEYSGDDERQFVHFGGLAGIGIAVLMLVAYGIYFSLSSVSSPRADATAYLDDIADNRELLSVVGWLLGLHALLIVPWAFAIYYRLREGRELAARVALVFGVIAAVFEGAFVAPAAIIAAHVAPEWAAATNDAERATLLSEFQILQWSNDIFVSAFDACIVVFQVVFGLAMLRVGTRWWSAIGYVTLASAAANAIGIFWLLEDSLYYVGGIGLILGWLFVLGVSLLLLTPQLAKPVFEPA